MSRRAQKALARSGLSVEIEGKAISGWYTHSRGVLTVHYGLSENSTMQVGPPDHMARLLLRELVEGRGDGL